MKPIAAEEAVKIKGPFRRAVLLIVFFAALLSLAACSAAPRTTALDPTLSRAVVDGYPFHTELYGTPDRPVVIAVHGGPGAFSTYLRPLSALSDEYMVVLYDQRGAGLSPRGDARAYAVDGFVKDLDAIIDHYSKGRPVRLIGHSWGGMLVAAYLSAHQEKVTHAVIAEPGMLDKNAAEAYVEELNKRNSFFDKLRLLPHIVASLFIRSEDGHEKLDYVMTKAIGSVDGPPYLCEGESFRAEEDSRAGYASFEAMTMPLMKDPALFDYDLTKGLNKYGGRLMLLSGDCSFIGYDYQQKNHAPLMPKSARHVKVEGAGHYLFTVNPDRSIGIVREFLGR